MGIQAGIDLFLDFCPPLIFLFIGKRTRRVVELNQIKQIRLNEFLWLKLLLKKYVIINIFNKLLRFVTYVLKQLKFFSKIQSKTILLFYWGIQ